MAANFARTLHTLHADGFRHQWLWMSLVLVLLGAWLSWFALAPITVYVASTSARLEVSQIAAPIQAPVSGRIIWSQLVLDADVAENELLLEFDSTKQQAALNEELARLDALTREISALERELRGRRQLLEDGRQVAQASVAEARARLKETEVAARVGRTGVERAVPLQRQGLISEAESEMLRADAQGRDLAMEAQERALLRTELEQRMRETTQRADLASLERELARLTGVQTVSEQALPRLEYEVELRRLRAPVAGRVGEVASLSSGSFVAEGVRLGAIVPVGGVRIVTEFPASEAVGLLRPGQSARLRLDAFPWTQFGSLLARVDRVANESQNGNIRVELSLLPAPNSPVPLQHGLIGTVEAAVEQTTPAMLVIRTAGAAFRSRLGPSL